MIAAHKPIITVFSWKKPLEYLGKIQPDAYSLSMFSVEITVRDYECDQQGIVNNAVYLNYLQHARHEYGRSVGLDWLELNKKGIDLVLHRAELDFIRSLHPGESIVVTAQPGRKGKFRFFFHQEIRLLPDNLPVVRAKVSVACVIDGKPAAPPELDKWFGDV